MLRASRRSNKYQFYSLWFDLIGALTHDLPHSSNHDVGNIFGLRNQNRDTQSEFRILTNHEIRNRFESGDENHNVAEPQLANGNTLISDLTADCVRSGQQNDGMTEHPSEGSSILHSTDKPPADDSDNNQVSSVIKRLSAV
jgi:hypothetical protein